MVGSASFVNDASPKPIENLNEWAGEEERKCPMKKQLWLLVPLAILAMGESCPTAVDDDGDGYTEDGGDCNDADPAVHPGAAELCNEVDDDCDGVIYGPSVPETCDGIDNNCNELIDESPWYRDADSDVQPPMRKLIAGVLCLCSGLAAEASPTPVFSEQTRVPAEPVRVLPATDGV
ncbi:MAG: hypothetical protein UT55_C0050G0008, partial [Candidatus Peregrinibacteria bacterium GW2011_GWE2_39_6]